MPAFKQANKTISSQILPRRLQCGAWAWGGGLCLAALVKGTWAPPCMWERWMSSAELVQSSLSPPPLIPHTSQGSAVMASFVQLTSNSYLLGCGRWEESLRCFSHIRYQHRGERRNVWKITGNLNHKTMTQLARNYVCFSALFPAVCTFWIARIIQI